MSDRRPLMETVWYGEGQGPRAMRLALAPFAAVYGGAVAARNALYGLGALPAGRAPAPAISVGSIRVGGSAKTPFVLWLARRLIAEGMKPCIVTRGYGGTARENAFVLRATDASTNTIVERAGDEAVLLALRSGCPVAVGASRLQACEVAYRKLAENFEPPDVFLLDDGFQHRALARDADIVMTDGSEPGLALLPAGPLREPLSALGRADAEVRVSMPHTGDGAEAGRRKPVPDFPKTVPVPDFRHATARLRATMLVSAVTDAGGYDPSWLDGRRVIAVAAIARPERFLADLERAGARVVAEVLRRDHHRYDERDGAAIDAAVAANAGAAVVTTEKDLVKLAHLRPRLAMLALRVEIEMDRPSDEVELVRMLIDRASRRRR